MFAAQHQNLPDNIGSLRKAYRGAPNKQTYGDPYLHVHTQRCMYPTHGYVTACAPSQAPHPPGPPLFVVILTSVNAPLDLLRPKNHWQGSPPIDPPTLAPHTERCSSIGASAPLSTRYRKGKHPTERLASPDKRLRRTRAFSTPQAVSLRV